jgi:hypothetical protein
MATSNDSILGSVRKLLGSDEYFDTDLIIHINTVFSKLQQMGVGPAGGFSISDDSTEWSSYTDNEPVLNMVKSYMFLQIRLYFDISTASSYLIDTMKEQSSELEWRLNSATDYNSK